MTCQQAPDVTSKDEREQASAALSAAIVRLATAIGLTKRPVCWVRSRPI
jgi:hypothetical protein